MDVVEEAIPGSELTVERVRTEVRALTERIAAKQVGELSRPRSSSMGDSELNKACVLVQWEVQLMVGSRYHELIDSADSVVSVHISSSAG